MAGFGKIKETSSKKREFVTLHTGEVMKKEKYQKLLSKAHAGTGNQPPPLKNDPRNN
ncbi:hypothetical protein IT402_00765 [Candidatus Nomurabacteria bacterium]|nr:hypothetical protein [Candidatus Nomurabacteria bacterium]